MKNINIKIIKENTNYLIRVHEILQKIWITLDKKIEYIKINDQGEDEKDYKMIYNKISNSTLMSYNRFSEFLRKYKKIIKLEYDNVKFYYFYNDQNDINRDIDKIIKMLKITVCLNKFYIKNDKVTRTIIWIPVPTNRDFEYKEINDNTLGMSYNKFEAFTVSGITFNINPRYTIITRYEEIEKLLLHELIHNFNMDGSNYHNELTDIIKNYDEIKNKNKSQIINYNYEYSIYESYSELAGTYLLLLFKYIDYDKKKLEDKIMSSIIMELIYSYNTIVNLAKLNNYRNWDEFIRNESFYGEICVYEYYYIKGLMYNNFKFKFYNKNNKFRKMYNRIIEIMKSTNNNELLKDIFNKSIKQNNYKYIIN
jgi:hypothetical protein